MLPSVYLDKPHWPFSLLFFIPLITSLAGFVILAEVPRCGGDEPWWEAKHVRLAFLPGVLNLVPLAWLFFKPQSTRQAGLTAGIMGAAQFALPQAALAYYAAVPGADGQIGNPSCTVSVFLLPWLVPSMVILWLGCVIIGVLAHRKLTR